MIIDPRVLKTSRRVERVGRGTVPHERLCPRAAVSHPRRRCRGCGDEKRDGVEPTGGYIL